MASKVAQLLFGPAPPGPSLLANYRILSPLASVRVSPLQFGTMSLGEGWADGFGAVDKEQSFKLLDAYFDAGGNFFDTANGYQNEDSEKILGEWMETRGVRDRCVIATKYTQNYKLHDIGKIKSINFYGNSKISVNLSIRDSLKKLRTERIDIFFLHWWDYSATVEEVMDALDILVKQGKVLYLGVSNTPAWIVSAANSYAKATGKTPFSVYQGPWSVLDRTLEKDIIPMCRQFGLAINPYGVLASGKLRSKKDIEDRKASGERVFRNGVSEQTETEMKLSEALEKVGEELGGKSIAAVALAYVLAKAPYTFPVVGGRKVEHLMDNIEALNIKLSDEQIKYLESVQPFELAWPASWVGTDPTVSGRELISGVSSARIDHVRAPRAVGYE